MTEQNDRREDEQLAAMFRDLAPSVADDGFTDVVVQRIRRPLWMRRVVLFLAVVIGGTLGIGSLWELAVDLGNGLMVSASRWHDPGWFIANESLLIAVLLLAGSPLAIRLFER